jgi:hypothetical protein
VFVVRRTLIIKIRISGVRETLRKFRELPKTASDDIRDASWSMAGFVALKARATGFSQGPQTALPAGTIKAVRDRVPAVVMGGTSRVGRNKVPVYKVMFGAEFGATYLKQFRPHLGRQGYFFFPTVEAEAGAISAAWGAAADDIVRKFSEGG